MYVVRVVRGTHSNIKTFATCRLTHISRSISCLIYKVHTEITTTGRFHVTICVYSLQLIRFYDSIRFVMMQQVCDVHVNALLVD